MWAELMIVRNQKYLNSTVLLQIVLTPEIWNMIAKQTLSNQV